MQKPIEEHSSSRQEGERLKSELNELLKEEVEEEKNIPEFLTCPISLEVMIDPKLLSSGHSYEKEEIKKHFKKNGLKDPLTNENVKAEQIDNINLRQTIEDYLEKYVSLINYDLGIPGVTSITLKTITIIFHLSHKIKYLCPKILKIYYFDEIYSL